MTSLLIKLFIKDSENTADVHVRDRYGRLGGMVGILCNLLLCIIKITVGIISGAISIVADGFNNLSDMGSSVITMIGFRMASKPADSDHPFGHGRMEYISALIVSFLIMLVGVELFKSSASSLIKNEAAPRFSVMAIVVLGVSVVIKLWLFLFNRTLAKKTDSQAFLNTAQDSINDVIASSAVLVSIIIGALFDLPFNLDAVMAAGVAIFIFWSGIMAARETLDSILGGPPEPVLVEEIERTVLSFENFLGIHDLIVHNYGPGRQFASVHVEVPQNTNIAECHEQIDICEKLVQEKTGVELVIHMDPIDTDDENISFAKSQLSTAISELHPRLSLHDFRMTPGGKNRTNLIFDVVVPDDIQFSHSELKEKIGELARNINKTYCCVITIDNDYTGR